MRIAVVLAAILAIACSRKDEPSAAKSAPAAPPASVGSASAAPWPASPTRSGVPAVSFVPDAILSQVGASHTILAVDFTKVVESGQLTKLVPHKLRCIRELIGSAGILVVGLGDSMTAIVTKLPERATVKCLERLGFGEAERRDGGHLFLRPDIQLSAVWTGDTAVITKLGDKPGTGTLAASVRREIELISPSAASWMISDEQEDLKLVKLWVEVSESSVNLFGSFEGKKPGAAKRALRDIRERMKKAVVDWGLPPLEDSWFRTSSTETTAAVELRLALPEP
ncbi:MAG: hypothetical protein HOV81_33890 [Kofleriaceae bacterium]|nr:hypothetical protein [Kofleriaceae bacterium]